MVKPSLFADFETLFADFETLFADFANQTTLDTKNTGGQAPCEPQRESHQKDTDKPTSGSSFRINSISPRIGQSHFEPAKERQGEDHQQKEKEYIEQ